MAYVWNYPRIRNEMAWTELHVVKQYYDWTNQTNQGPDPFFARTRYMSASMSTHNNRIPGPILQYVKKI